MTFEEKVKKFEDAVNSVYAEGEFKPEPCLTFAREDGGPACGCAMGAAAVAAIGSIPFDGVALQRELKRMVSQMGLGTLERIGVIYELPEGFGSGVAVGFDGWRDCPATDDHSGQFLEGVACGYRLRQRWVEKEAAA